MDVIYWLLTARIIHEFENLLKFPVWSMAVSISVKNNNNYWTRLSKIYIVICQWWADHYLPKLNAKSNNIDLQVRKVCFLKNIFRKRSNLPFSCKSDRKKEISLVSFTHEQNIICSQKIRWTTLCILSGPLFVGSYLQVTWWGLGQWKGRKICNEW